MKFEKKGLVYSPPFDGSWRDNSALTPTPLLINKDTIRVFAGFRDKMGVSRIGFVDVDANVPTIIKKISTKPALDIGSPGMFDDNGMILGDVLLMNGKIYMYYVGFQLVQKVKFLAFTGLAISEDEGDTFMRYSQTPILDRSDEGRCIRAIHSVESMNGEIHAWYGRGSEWQFINGVPYPVYDIYHITSSNGMDFPKLGRKCITTNQINKEYRIGRPRVYKLNGKLIMMFTYGTLDGRYMAGAAFSDNGTEWTRDDDKLGIELSDKGWDSIHLSYPALLSVLGKTYMFYNGNSMGYDGFGLAEMVDDTF